MTAGNGPLRIGIVGAGVAGSVIAAGLKDIEGLNVRCFERVGADDHQHAGTGLNVGPNALKCLQAFLPDLTAEVRAASLPWERWFIGLTDGTPLMDLDMLDVADNPGIRICWSELYRVLRAEVADAITYGVDVQALDLQDGAATLRWRDGEGMTHHESFDLVIAGDGRYSAIRSAHFGAEEPRQLGVALFRALFQQPEDGPIGDYAQWFNGPNRLLAFETPGRLVYCAGSFPIAKHEAIPEASKDASALCRYYEGPNGLDDACSFLVDKILECAETGSLHWARIQDGSCTFAHPGGRLLLVGDAAHPLVPTLGQGATQAIEDACAVIAAAQAASRGAFDWTSPADEVERVRAPRIDFVSNLSQRATDTMLAGSDPVIGTSWKTQTPFKADLHRLYTDPPMCGLAYA